MYIGFIIIMSLAQKVATTNKTFTCSKLLRSMFLITIDFQCNSAAIAQIRFVIMISTLLILAVCRTRVTYQPSKWPSSPRVSCSSVG